MPKKPTLPDLLTITQAASFLETTRQAVWSAIKEGRLEATKYGTVFLITRNAATTYKNSRRGSGPAPKNKLRKS